MGCTWLCPLSHTPMAPPLTCTQSSSLLPPALLLPQQLLHRTPGLHSGLLTGLLHSSLAPHDLLTKQPGDPFHSMSLLCSKPLCSPLSSRVRSEAPVVYRILPDLPWLPLTSSPSLSPFSSVSATQASVLFQENDKKLLPQGLCTCCPSLSSKPSSVISLP